MATVDIALGSVQSRGSNGGTLPVLDSKMIDHDVITLSASSQQSDFSIPVGSTGLIWIITAVDAALRIKFGPNPTAVAAEDGGWYIASGTRREFAAIAGDKAAVIAAE